MEKINIAELLKDCPKGMELDCTVFEGIEFDSIVDNHYFPIRCRIKNSNDEYNFYNLTKHGYWNNDYKAKCVIFPKGKTTWEGFHKPFVKGDIVSTEHGIYIGIVKSTEDSHSCDVFCAINDDNDLFIDKNFLFSRFATEEEKEKLFKVIKDNGYRWDDKTKTLGKLITIFKVGDKIKLKNVYAKKYNDFNIRKITEIKDSHYILDDKQAMPLANQYLYELVSNKFDINTLVPFESKVLVRDTEEEKWKPAIWGYYDDNNTKYYPYETVGGNCFQLCIPYDKNEHLLNTTNDCNDFYKTWE